MNAFRHSGKLGDIVYSLPAVKALGGGVFYVDPFTRYPEKSALGMESAQWMVELLETQDYIHRAAVFAGEPVSHNLDRFRVKAVPLHIFNVLNREADKLAGALFGKQAMDFRRSMIPNAGVDVLQIHWEAAGLPGKADRDTPWLEGIPPRKVADIVISRTGRYSGTLDWRLLEEHKARAVFVGHESEWRSFTRDYFDIEFYQTGSLLDFAQTIAGARLYIGNQSFGLALAEAMLIPRVAELSEAHPVRMSAVHGYHVLTHEVLEAYIHL